MLDSGSPVSLIRESVLGGEYYERVPPNNYDYYGVNGSRLQAKGIFEQAAKGIHVSVDCQRDSPSDLNHIESLVSGTTPLMHLLEVIDANQDEVGELTQSANEDSFVQHATGNVQVNHSAETQCSVAVERVKDNASFTDIGVKSTVDNARHDITVERTVDKARHNVAVERVADPTKDDCVSHAV